MKTAISVPDQTFQAAEILAQRLGMSRSELYSSALRQFLKEHKNQGVTENLNRVYGNEDNSLDEGYNLLQYDTLESASW